ncbi:MAG TPA: ABC transporter ATP-binding protein [Thermomicrobiales bacterium]|nr:ABC transporter ATP-binding protein [Thermomicrobiales bacterium]
MLAGTSDSIIETAGLTKRYGRQIALESLDLAVPHGAVGLLGANGAGKTTLLRLLLGLSRPDAGTATVLGHDTRRDAIKVRERVGFMPESDCLPRDTTAADFVGHMAEMSGLPARMARQRAADVLYHVGLDEERYRLIKGFSTGMKQRVKLAQALVHGPGVVFLDEPTNGLDPRGRDEMLDLIDRIHRGLGIAILISSHILDDIERVCSFVVILDHGRLMLAQPLGNSNDDTGEILVRISSDAALLAARLEQAGLDVRLLDGNDVDGEIAVRPESDLAYDLIRDMVAELDLGLRSLRPRSSSLEELYIAHVGSDRERGSGDGRHAS